MNTLLDTTDLYADPVGDDDRYGSAGLMSPYDHPSRPGALLSHHPEGNAGYKADRARGFDATVSGHDGHSDNGGQITAQDLTPAHLALLHHQNGQSHGNGQVHGRDTHGQGQDHEAYDPALMYDDLQEDGVKGDGKDAGKLDKKGGKGKAGADEGEDGKVRRTRQSQSCDACRARKVKCDRGPPADSSTTATDKCSHCRVLNMDCTFNYKPKKRGPPNRYLEKLQAESQRKDVKPDVKNESGRRDLGLSRGLGGPDPSWQNAYAAAGMSNMSGGDGGGMSHGDWMHGPGGGGGGGRGINGQYAQPGHGHAGISPFDGSAHGRAMDGPASGSTSWTPNQDRTYLGTSAGMAPSSSGPLHSPLASASGGIHVNPYFGLPLDPALTHPSSSSASLRSANPLDMVLPRQLLHQVVNLYFDYVYALIPIIHRPTFMHDLHHNREERPGQEEWTCMTLALVAATLVQVPRSFVSMPRREVKQLAETCYKRGRAYLSMDIPHPASVQVLTSLYLLCFTANLLNRPAEGGLLFGGLAGAHIRGQWTDANNYTELSPLEGELRRRIYWIAYGGDRSWSAIEGTHCVYPEEDISGMPYPLEIDDEFISDAGISEQPAGTTSLISGFVCISRIYRICGHVMDRRRRDKKSPPQGVLLQMRLNEVNDLYDQVMEVMDGCPDVLKLELESDTRSNDGFSEDWDTHASAGIRSLFLDPKASKAVVKDAYLVQQGNIYVAQQMVRYMVILYREDLYELQKLELARSSGSIPMSGPSSSHAHVQPPVIGNLIRRKSSTRRDWEQTLAASEEKEQVASDLLAILQKIPIQVIAINSVSLVTKVRFVASSLLDALANPALVQQDATPAQIKAALKTQRAQTYLWDFLRILSEIELLYSLDDDAK